MTPSRGVKLSESHYNITRKHITNIERLEKGKKKNIGNSILIKVNQIGTVSETLATNKLAKEKNYLVNPKVVIL